MPWVAEPNASAPTDATEARRGPIMGEGPPGALPRRPECAPVIPMWSAGANPLDDRSRRLLAWPPDALCRAPGPARARPRRPRRRAHDARSRGALDAAPAARRAAVVLRGGP